MPAQIRIGTRQSPLALKQAEIVRSKIAAAATLVPMQTSGDLFQKGGGKGLFIKELEQALLRGEIDMAVHSLKDVTTRLEPGLRLAAFLKAESCLDVVIGKPLSQCKIVGTSSLRRKALIKKSWPHIQTVELRGNVETRIRKIETEGLDAIILSEAGLIRLGLTDRITERMDPIVFPPAPGQGVITVEVHQNAESIREICASLNDLAQENLSRLELLLVDIMGLDCSAPLGVYSRVENGTFRMNVFLSGIEEALSCPLAECEAAVRKLGHGLLPHLRRS